LLARLEPTCAEQSIAEVFPVCSAAYGGKLVRVLLVTPSPPSRIRVRSLGFASQLARQHKVTVLTLCTGEQELADVLALQRAGIDVIAIGETRLQQSLRSLRALSTPLPFQVAYGAAPALRLAIVTQLASGRFDVLHVEHMRALGALPESLPISVVWDAVDCVSRLYEQGSRAAATPLLRFIGASEAKRTRAYEHCQLRRFRHVLVTSARERQALLDLAGVEGDMAGEITVLPHGVDQEYFRPHSGEREPKTLIFSGKMSFHANVAGVQMLVEHILPRIWARRPDVRLVIAGSNPPAWIRHLARDPRIEITGYLADLRPPLTRAQVAVSPLPYAVGIQNKVLEAMAVGTPVVASSQAAGGLQAIAGEDLLVADEPERFAEAVLRLLGDRALWYRLAERGPAYIAAHHNWQHIVRQLTEVYAHATD
jgi:glycosyltransferase involved in cell wall biosynthesis